MLGLPLVGSSGGVLRVAQDKHLTRLVAQSAGVRVAEGVLVEAGDGLDLGLEFPVVVKPNTADNSEGLAVVRSAADLPPAVAQALRLDRHVLIEAFVPGREIRGAVIELDGRLEALSFIEYGVSDAHPVRTASNKLRLDDRGSVIGQERESAIASTCPAVLDADLQTDLVATMTMMHRALGCRDVSLYDFRLHRDTGAPYLLEAGLFWSFGPPSMVSQMLAANGRDLAFVTAAVWRAAAVRRPS